jgi:chemotaxis protein histidine kinase CheA/ActR/RegA family two-component response regulator
MRGAVQRLAESLRPLDADVRRLDERARDLCVVPVAPLATHLERVARDAAATLGREVRLVVEGREARLDKELVDLLKGPLTHAVRNAVDHGIEDPRERTAAGKPEAGTLRLSLEESGQSIRITLADDGRGIDRGLVRARLGERARGLGDAELLAALLRSGISTRDTATELSGRGLGLGSLAVVADRLRGDATLTSELGQGTSIELRLPLRLSLLEGLLVEASGCRFVLPVDALLPLGTPCADPVRLATHLGLPDAGAPGRVLVLRGRTSGAGIVVDSVGATLEVVRRPLGAHLGRVPCVEGATILPDGEPALILDARELADSLRPADAGERSRRILLVDDSATLRATLGRALLEAGHEVVLAEDGQEALERLAADGCDGVVSDVQMPRLGGWELLERCAGRLPFVLMTAYPEEGGPERARALGACAYFAKDEALAGRVVAALETALSQPVETSL